MRELWQKLLTKLFYRHGLFPRTRNLSRYCQTIDADTSLDMILNIGAGGYRPVQRAINCDPFRLQPGDVQCWGESLPFKNDLVDCVVCGGVLEHVPHPQLLIDEMVRVLKPGGKIYIEFPFLQPFHAAPHDYGRVTLPGLRTLLKDCDELDAGICTGPGSMMCWIGSEFMAFIFQKPRWLSRLALYTTQLVLSPLPMADKFLVKWSRAEELSSGYYFYGEKPHA